MAVALLNSQFPRPHGAGELALSMLSHSNMNQESSWLADRWRPSVVDAKGSPNAAANSPPQSELQRFREAEQQRPFHSQSSRPHDTLTMKPTSQRAATPAEIQQHKTDHPLDTERSRLTQPFAFSHTIHDDRNTPNYHQRETHAGSWRSLQDDRCTSSSHIASAPQLTLHIPNQVSDLPKIPMASKQENRPYGVFNPQATTPTTSLPSFATLRQHANAIHDEEHERENVSRLPNQPVPQQQQPQRLPPATSIQNLSPPSSLKRSREVWDHEDVSAVKRPRSGASSELPFQLPVYTPREDRRTSTDFANGRESQGRGPAFPSPPSYGYPPSAAPTLPPPTVTSNGSPANSYHPSVSIHTTSTSSATSAHIADLQHQVTLKSLAMQTLQSEYASLLQKFQRERVKSQAIEKKTTVADQEVNDLTGKNEDLMDRVKELELQLEECEKKREAERLEAARDKEQWGRMLDMSGRLHAKIVDERQKLIDEKSALQQRITCLTGSNSPQSGTPSDLKGNERSQLSDIGETLSGFDVAQSDVSSTIRGTRDLDEVASLRREVKNLRARIATLRSTLEAARLQSRDMEIKTRELEASIGRSLQEDEEQATLPQQGAPQYHMSVTGRLSSNRSTPGREKPVWELPRPTVINPAATQASSQQKLSQGTFEYISNGKTTTAIIADVARADSPGPEELGIHVVHSNASPEELIKALGPVPAPTPSLHAKGQQSPSTSDNHGKEPKQTPQDASKHWIDQSRVVGSSPQSYHSNPARSSHRRLGHQSLRETQNVSPSRPPGIKSIADERPKPSDHVDSSSLPAVDPEKGTGQQDWMPPPPPPRSLDLLPHVQA